MIHSTQGTCLVLFWPATGYSTTTRFPLVVFAANHLLRMVSWNLNTLIRRWWKTPLAHHLTFGFLSHFGPIFIKSVLFTLCRFRPKHNMLASPKSRLKTQLNRHQLWLSHFESSVSFFGNPPKKRGPCSLGWRLGSKSWKPSSDPAEKERRTMCPYFLFEATWNTLKPSNKNFPLKIRHLDFSRIYYTKWFIMIIYANDHQ